MDDLRFYVYSTVFQSFQDDGWVIMKDCEQWNPVCNSKDLLPKVGLQPGTSRSVGQHLPDLAIGAPEILENYSKIGWLGLTAL